VIFLIKYAINLTIYLIGSPAHNGSLRIVGVNFVVINEVNSIRSAERNIFSQLYQIKKDFKK
jgi:hypothetical protein